jgi:SSS family transporter
MLVAFVIFYFVLNLVIGWFASTKVHTSTDFVLAGRTLSWGLATMVTFATWFGSETLLGSPREFIHGGLYAVIEEPFGAALGLFIVGAIYARKLYPLPVLTFSDYFRIRFGAVSEKISALVMIPSYFGWISAQLVALGLTLHLLLPISTELGIVIGALIVMTYTLMGGMWSISITDFLHNIILIIGLIILAYLLLDKIPDLGKFIDQQPKGFFRFTPLQNTWLEWLKYLGAWIVIGLGSIPQQDIFQRVMSAKSGPIAAKASIAAGTMYITIALLPLLIGLIGVRLYPSLMAHDTLLIPQLVMQFMPYGIQVLFLGALLSALLSTTSGAIIAPASVLGENLWKPLLKNPSDKKVLLIIRFSVVWVTLACIWMAVSRQNIFELVGEASAFSLVSLFIPLNAGLWWKKASPMGSHLSMLFGLFVWAYVNFINPSEIPAIWFGLAASLMGLLVGTYGFPRQTMAAE